jgi:hypothetical protein
MCHDGASNILWNKNLGKRFPSRSIAAGKTVSDRR